MKKIYTFLLLILLILGCKSSAKDAVDLINGVPRRQIDTGITGLNAFVNDSRFGTIGEQFEEVQQTLRLGFVRVLMSWDDGVQSGPNATPNFAFYDDIVANVPDGMDVLIVMTHVPSWMKNSKNWIDGNPRKTFVENWVKKVVHRYRDNPRVTAFQVWNEPNMATVENDFMGLDNSAANYVEMLRMAHAAIKEINGGKRVVSAATTAINQNYPDSLNYNRLMRDNEAERFLDIWGVHYYGKQFERVVIDGGVADYLNGLSKPLWVTESGEQGVDKQLAYVEQVWPFLRDQIPGIERFYYYQFTEASSPETTYGLRNLSETMPTSDLYDYLKNR